MALFGGISKVDIILMVTHMAIALKAGLTLDEAIQINIDQSSSKNFTKMMEEIRESIVRGETLANSLKPYPKVFSHVFISVIDSGEKGGTLEKNLEHMGMQLQKEYDLQQKVQGAMIYPAIIFFSTIGISIALSTFVLPRLIPLFQSFGQELPPLTRAILAIADFFKSYGIIVLIATIAGIFLFRYLKKIPSFSYQVDRMLLRLPIFGPLFISMHLARFNRTLGTLLSSGLSINESLQITETAQDNAVYKEIIRNVERSVDNGGTIFEVLDQYRKLIPVLASRMVGLGEKTGNLDSTFIYLADYYEKDLYAKSNNLATTIEPLLLIFVGLGVGVVAIAIIAPIYQLTGSLNRFRQ